jgi:hypothetical protein
VNVRVLDLWNVASCRFSNIQIKNLFMTLTVDKRNEVRVSVWNLRKTNDFKSLVLDGMIILERVFKK